MKKISEYIIKDHELTTLSVKLDKKLKTRVQRILKQNSTAKRKVGWNSLIEACLKRYCEEEEKA